MNDNSDSTGDAPSSLPQALASQALTHIVAHSLRSAGFTTASTRAIHTLSAALELYLCHLACRAVSNAQDTTGRRVPAWDDVLAVLEDFAGIGDVADVKRLVEKELAVVGGSRAAGFAGRNAGVSAVLQGRARRYRETGGRVALEMNEDEAEDWVERDELRRRAALGGSGMLSRLPGMDLAAGGRYEERRVERGHVKGLGPLRAHLQEGLPTSSERAARPVLHSIELPPPDQYIVRTRSPSPDLESEFEDEDLGRTANQVKREQTSPDSPRGLKRRRESLEQEAKGKRHLPNQPELETAYLPLKSDIRHSTQGQSDDEFDNLPRIFDAPYLPPLPGKVKLENHPAEDRQQKDDEMTGTRDQYTRHRIGGESAAIESARRTALEIYTSGAIPYEQSTLSIAYDVSHLTAMEWRKPRGMVPPILPSVVPSLVKAYNAAKIDVLKAPPSKSSRSFKIAAADALSATVGHPMLHTLAGTTNQVPGLANGSGSATPKGNPFVPSYPIWAKTELPVNEAHEKDRKEKEVYPVKPLPRESAPLGPTVALNVLPSPAIFNPRHPELLRTLLTEMAGHPLIDQPSRSGWLRPNALRQFTTIQPPEALKVDAATAAESGGDLRVGQPYLYGDAVRAPGQLGSMDAKIRAAKAKDRKLKASQKADGTRKLKISFAGASVAKSDTETLAEQLATEEALLKDQDEIMLRATWPIMDEERGDWQTVLEPLQEEQQSKRVLACGTGKRLSDILPPPQQPSNGTEHSAADRPAGSDRKLVFKWKRPGEITPISESPPTPSATLGGRDSPVGIVDEENEQGRSISATPDSRTSLKFKLKFPTTAT